MILMEALNEKADNHNQIDWMEANLAYHLNHLSMNLDFQETATYGVGEQKVDVNWIVKDSSLQVFWWISENSKIF